MRVTSSQAETTNAPFVPRDRGARAPEHRLPSHRPAHQFAELRAWEVFDGWYFDVFALSLALPLLAATVAAAQGVQTGEVSGTVRSSDGLTLPGATVTRPGAGAAGRANGRGRRQRHVRHPRAAAGHIHGDVRDERPRDAGPRPWSSSSAGRPSLNASLAVGGGARRASTVNAEVNTAGLTSPTVGANYTTREINQLPTGRTPALIAELAPGLTANTPNTGQVTISGGVRLRQRVHDQRRRHQRQPVRQPATTSSSRTRSRRRRC